MSSITQEDLERMGNIFQDVTKERIRQIEDKGYDHAHDDQHHPRDMVKFANWRFTNPLTLEARTSGRWFSRQSFIEAIAILVAAVEVMDRRAARRDQSPSE